MNKEKVVVVFESKTQFRLFILDIVLIVLAFNIFGIALWTRIPMCKKSIEQDQFICKKYSVDGEQL